VLHLVREVDVFGRVSGDRGLDALNLPERLRDDRLAEDGDRSPAGPIVTGAAQR
jgi:hypothetical protein